LAPGRPIYGVYLTDEVEWLSGKVTNSTLPEMAQRYLDLIRKVQPHGPYYLLGHSFGGLVAYDMAQQLVAQGEIVPLLTMMDCQIPHNVHNHSTSILGRVRLHMGHLKKSGLEYVREKLLERLRASWWSLSAVLLLWYQRIDIHPPRAVQVAAGLRAQAIGNDYACNAYQAKTYDGQVILFRALHEESSPPDFGWSPLVRNLSVHHSQGDHMGILRTPHVEIVANLLDRHLSVAPSHETTTLGGPSPENKSFQNGLAPPLETSVNAPS